jgi:hypothetical protein
MSIYSGKCDSLELVDCDDNDSPNGSMPFIYINDTSYANDTVYIMVWKYADVHGGTFGICTYEPDAPENPDCMTSTNIVVKNSCNYYVKLFEITLKTRQNSTVKHTKSEATTYRHYLHLI